MTLLAELDRLAQAATPVLTKRYASYDSEKLRAFHDACEPEVILKLLACIEAADALSDAIKMRRQIDNYPKAHIESVREVYRELDRKQDAFDAALAALEEK